MQCSRHDALQQEQEQEQEQGHDPYYSDKTNLPESPIPCPPSTTATVKAKRKKKTKPKGGQPEPNSTTDRQADTGCYITRATKVTSHTHTYTHTQRSQGNNNWQEIIITASVHWRAEKKTVPRQQEQQSHTNTSCRAAALSNPVETSRVELGRGGGGGGGGGGQIPLLLNPPGSQRTTSLSR